MPKRDKEYKQLLREIVILQKENELLRKELRNRAGILGNLFPSSSPMAEDMICSYQNEQYEEEWSDD